MGRSIKKSLGAFSDRDLQTFRNIVLTLRNDGNDIDEALDFIEAGKNRLVSKKQQEQINDLTKKCPNCGSLLRLFTIEQENSEGYKSVWRCSSCIGCKGEDEFDETDPNKRCTYEKFSYHRVEEYEKKYNEAVSKIMTEE